MIHKGPAVREYPFLHANNEHIRELQPLRAVHRHQHNRIAAILFIIIHRIDIRDERKIGQEGDQRLVFVILLKFLRDRQELVNVLKA